MLERSSSSAASRSTWLAALSRSSRSYRCCASPSSFPRPASWPRLRCLCGRSRGQLLPSP
eukprot:3902679-Alexandrium_andersonii.AAC.1